MVGETSSMTTDLYGLADTLGMDLLYNHREQTLKGDSEFKISTGVGPTLSLKVKTVFSRVYNNMAKALIVAHVAGDMYVLLLYSGLNREYVFMVLDGSKLGWYPDTVKPLDGNAWSREKLFRNIEAGVKSVHTRKEKESDWTPYPLAKKHISLYLTYRDEGGGSKDACTKMGVKSSNVLFRG